MGEFAEVVVRFAGTAGEGALTAGELLGRLLSRAGYHVFGTVQYEAEVRGERLAMSQVRAATAPLASGGDRPAILAAFGREAVEAHREELAPGGLLVFDSRAIDDFGDVTDYRAADVAGQEALGAPFLEMAWKKAGRQESKNMAVLGAVGAVLGLDLEALRETVKERFGAAGKTAAANLEALRLGYAAAGAAAGSRRLAPGDGRRRPYLTGNQAVALGALAAGCRFFAGYPITPASEIMEELAGALPAAGGAMVQLEDEMAALAAAIGASFGGARAMTATSGPGFSLMTELVGYAAAAEIPVVVVNVQRGGPATGLPTRPEQADLLHAVAGGHGDAPRVVLAPGSVAACFEATVHAFNLAERCQVPVILLSDQYLGQRRETVGEEQFAPPVLEERRRPGAAERRDYRRYLETPDGVSPMAVPGEEDGAHLATGLEHDARGRPDSRSGTHVAMAAKRARKLDLITDPGCSVWGEDGAGAFLVCWGSLAGLVEEAARRLRGEGVALGAAALTRLSPWPASLGVLLEARRVYCVEMNFSGQLALLLRAHGLRAESLPWPGRLPRIREICDWVRAREARDP